MKSSDMEMFSRTKILIGEIGLDKLRNSSVMIVGVGGVGGYVCEMLVRAGIGKLILIDGDTVDISNKNRQIIALDSTIGLPKVEAFRTRIFDICKETEVVCHHKRFNAETAQELFAEKVDFVVDAIDSVGDKVDLICEASQRKIPIVSAMGAGKRFATPQFCIEDIYRTSYDKLAKKMRKLLKDRGVQNLPVCYSNQSVEGGEGDAIGSISYAPAISGCVIAGYVCQTLVEQTRSLY